MLGLSGLRASIMAQAGGVTPAMAAPAAPQAQAPSPAVTTPVTPPAKAPEVSEASKLRLQTFAQQIEIAQLRAQLAQADYEKSQAALDALVRALQVDGYALDLRTLTYSKRTEAPIDAPRGDSGK
jgi:hypothetical protein